MPLVNIKGIDQPVWVDGSPEQIKAALTEKFRSLIEFTERVQLFPGENIEDVRRRYKNAQEERAADNLDLRAGPATRPHTHTKSELRNPFHGVTESFAMGVYEAPGELFGLFDEIINLSPWGNLAKSAKLIRDSRPVVDKMVGVGELDYSLDNYEGARGLLRAARFFGNLVGDPLNVIPPAKGAGAVARAGVDDVLRSRSVTGQGGMVDYQGSPTKHSGMLDPQNIN